MPPKEKKYTRMLMGFRLFLTMWAADLYELQPRGAGEFCVQTLVLLPGPRLLYGELALLDQEG